MALAVGVGVIVRGQGDLAPPEGLARDRQIISLITHRWNVRIVQVVIVNDVSKDYKISLHLVASLP